MSSYELAEVKRLLAQGFSVSKVSRLVGVDAKAVYRVAEELQRGQ